MSNLEAGGPAFPVVGHFWGDKLGGQLNHGMTLRQYAAIKLKVPNSGTDWLDEMIRQSLVNDFAAQAMQGFASTLTGTAQVLYEPLARDAYNMADAMLKAGKIK